MKKHSINRKLVLNRKTVSNLDDRAMENVKGGEIYPRTDFWATCVSEWAHCLTDENCSCVVGGCI